MYLVIYLLRLLNGFRICLAFVGVGAVIRIYSLGCYENIVNIYKLKCLFCEKKMGKGSSPEF